MAAGRIEDAHQALSDVRESPAVSRQYVNRFYLAVGESLLARSAERLDEALRAFADSAPMDVAVARVLAADVIGGPTAAAGLRRQAVLRLRADRPDPSDHASRPPRAPRPDRDRSDPAGPRVTDRE